MVARDDHLSGITIACYLTQLTRKVVLGRDTRRATTLRESRIPFCLALLQVGFTKPTRSPWPLVSSYLTFSPLPRDRNDPFGGFFSVALSLVSRPVDVIDHPALRSPDFPPTTRPWVRRQRSSDRLAIFILYTCQYQSFAEMQQYLLEAMQYPCIVKRCPAQVQADLLKTEA